MRNGITMTASRTAAFLVVLSMAGAAWCAGPEWKRLDQNEDSLFYYDSSGPKRQGDATFKVRTRVVYTDTGKADAVKIMAARSGVSPAEYLPMLKGTKLLSLDEGKKVYMKGDTYQSLYGSTEIANTFNWYNKVYTYSQKVDSYIDPSFTSAK